MEHGKLSRVVLRNVASCIGEQSKYGQVAEFGQMQRAVDSLPSGYGGSNPSLPTRKEKR